MIFAAAVIGGFLIAQWATNDPQQLPNWRWGDKPRGREKVPDGFFEHVLGFFSTGFAAVYALNYPICG
jgi:hypothetical protein